MSTRTYITPMGEDQVIGSGSWVEVFSIAQPAIELWSFVLVVNTDKLRLRVTLDAGTGEEAVIVNDIDLEKARNDLRLDKISGLVLETYHTKRWAFRPAEPQWANSNFRIELRSKSGNKRLEKGLVVWGER